MSKSLQEQLLGAGLVDAKAAKKIFKDKRKQNNEKRRNKDESLSESQQAVVAAQQAKQARDLALNQQRKAEEDKKAIAAQIVQLIEHYRVVSSKGEVGFNFTDGGKVKKIYVTQELSDQLSRGRLCIARRGTVYELIPQPIAEKIAERDASAIVVRNDKVQVAAHQSEDDAYYAQFEIPDDLMW